jgi:hypothetical protein
MHFAPSILMVVRQDIGLIYCIRFSLGVSNMKPLKMNMTVYDATTQYPELIGIIAGMGFPQIRNAYLRRVIGSRFTLNEAIAELGLNRDRVLNHFKQKGFQIIE